MGQGLSCFPIPKLLLVLVDMVDFELSKESFTTMDLRIDRSQSSHGLGTIQVGNGSQEVGQVFKEIGHPTTFVVNQQECHIMRVEVDSEGQVLFFVNSRADKHSKNIEFSRY